MTKFSERVALFAAVFSLVAGLVDGALARRTGLLSVTALLPFVALALILSILALVRLRLARLTAEEKQDQALARQSTSTLFEESAAEAFTVARSRDQFERFFIPAVPLLLAIAEALWAWKLWKTLPWLANQPRDQLIGCAFLAGQAFFLFLLSRYQLGLSRANEQRVLRGSGIAMGFACYASIAAAIAAAVSQNLWPGADALIARISVVALFLLAAEGIIAFLVASYSPRRRQAYGTAYESRLAAALTDPAGWSRNFAQALDYQFGFKISETGLYRSLSRVLLPLLAAQAILLYLFSCFVFLGPEEEGILERMGRPPAQGWRLTSGAHLKWPWPFETVRRFPARRVLVTHIGYQNEGEAKPPNVLLWTIPHFKSEDNFVVPSRPRGTASAETVPVNLVTMNVPIEYSITNLFTFAYRHADPDKLLRQLAYRALTREVSRLDLAELLGPERENAARRLRDDLQGMADAQDMGIRVEFVALANVHPPVAVAPAFQSVVGATEEREAAILTARAYAGTVVPLSEANAEKARREADAYKFRRTQVSSAEVDQFLQREKAYLKSPQVFKSRARLSSLRTALVDARKYIVDGADAREVLYFNFEEKPSPDLFDLSPAPAPGGKK